MNRMLIFVLLGMTVEVVLGPEFATAQVTYKNVFVQASSNGRGVLRARGTQCFAITPNHVVGLDASTIRLIAPDARTATGGLVQRFSDLAAVEVIGLEEEACAEWTFPDGLPELIASAVDATIVGLTEVGTEELVPVKIVGRSNRSFRVRPENSADKIIQGFSGSAVYIHGALAGIVTDVFPDGSGGVYRIDRAEESMGYFFPGTGPSLTTMPPEVTIRAEPRSIEEGESVTLEWTSTAADWAELNGEIVSVNGIRHVQLSTSEKFIILVGGPGGEDQASILVDVVPKTSTCTILAPSMTYSAFFALRVYVNDEYEGPIELAPFSSDELEFECSEGLHRYRLEWTYAGYPGRCEGWFEVFGGGEYIVGLSLSPYGARCVLAPR